LTNEIVSVQAANALARLILSRCSLSHEDLSTASATSIWIGFQAINGFVSWSALLSSTVCSVTSISFVEGKARRADTLGSCVPRDSAVGAFSAGRIYTANSFSALGSAPIR